MRTASPSASSSSRVAPPGTAPERRTPPQPRAARTAPQGPLADGPGPRAQPASHPAGPAGSRPGQPCPGGARPGRQTRQRSLLGLATYVANLYLEVECGRRPAGQVARLLDPRLAAQLESVWYRPGQPGRLLRIAGGCTADDVFDAVAVVARGRRVGALAIRLARRGGRWHVLDAYRPEDGPLPEPDLPPEHDDLLDALDPALELDGLPA